MISNSNSEFPNSSGRIVKNLMEGNRLDLDAPLLSVRRFGASEPDTGSAGDPNPKRSFLPFYKSDLKSGPLRNPGVVPFVWEQSPGQPKDSHGPTRPMAPPSLPPGRIPNNPSPAPVSVRTLRKSVQPEEVNPRPLPGQRRGEEDEEEREEEVEEEEFADALETLSRTESYFLNCSEPSEASRTFSTADPQEAKDFMMDRFLPAAEAMATGSPHCLWRKPPRRAKEVLDRPRSRVPLSYQYGPYCVRYGDEAVVGEEEDVDDCYDESNNGNFLGKGCGLIPNFCFKSSLCLLNPVPGMKVPNRKLVSKRMDGREVKAMPNGYLSQAEEEYSWEQVYKHNLTQTYSPKDEDRSKVTSESDHLTYGSDSHTADGSSPYRHSNCGGISPYRNEPSQSPFYEGRGFLGVPQREKKNSTHDGLESFEKKHRDDYWPITPTGASFQGSGSLSPAVDRTPHSIDTSSENKGTVQSADEDSEVGVGSRRMGESFFLENRAATDENIGLKHHDSAPASKEEEQVRTNADLLQSLLPPPLPNSPSESWLSRALPSVSSKNPSTQSFLGMQIHPKKKAINASSTDVKLIIGAKPPRPQHGPTRFADMLENPQSPQSEI